MTGDPKMIELLLGEFISEPERWWWLSFADGGRPVGEQFLGVVVVRGCGMGMAVGRAHQLKINPGGEVQGLPFPDELVPPAEYTNRLLSKAEALELDRVLTTAP